MASNPQCYRESDGVIAPAMAEQPCALPNGTKPFVSCCHEGDRCLDDEFCLRTPFQYGGSGYYMAGSTNPYQNDSTSTGHCTQFVWPDAVYNSTTNEWACCNGTRGSNSDQNQPTCNTPTNRTWKAPAPRDLETITSLPQMTATFTASTTATSFVTAATANGSVNNSTTGQGDLNKENKELKISIAVGIGIGVPLLIAFALLAWYIFRRRQGPDNESPKQKFVSYDREDIIIAQKDGSSDRPELHQSPKNLHEGDNSAMLHELPNGLGHTILEMPADSKK